MKATLSRQYIHAILELCSEGRLNKTSATGTILQAVKQTAVAQDESNSKTLVIKKRSYLHRNGFIATNSHGAYALTVKGSRLLRQYRLGQPLQTTRWDGKWRLVLYDIPETHRSGRIALLKTLKSLGFWQLQRSIWVFPYDCEKRIRYVASSFDLQSKITYLEASYTSQDAKLLAHFGLTKP